MSLGRASLRVLFRLSVCALVTSQLGCPSDRRPSDDGERERPRRPDSDESAAEVRSGGGYPLEVIDDSGTRHHFGAPPERIVSLVPSATETLLALGIGERLVGRTDYDRLPELRGLPSVGGGLQPNLEVLVALEPDLVIVFEGESDRATGERLRNLGVPHFSIRPDGIADIRTIVERLGRITGTTPAADSLLAGIQGALDDVAARVESRPRRKVVYLMGGEPPWVAGPGTYIHELMVAGGADNVVEDLGGLYGPISLEELLTREVDLILVSEQTGAVPPQLSAVAQARVPGWVEVPGPRLGKAARTLARLVHPEAFR